MGSGCTWKKRCLGRWCMDPTREEGTSQRKARFPPCPAARSLLINVTGRQVPDPNCFEDLSLRAAPSTRYPSCGRLAVPRNITHLSTERTFPLRRHHLHLTRFLHTLVFTTTTTPSTGTGRETRTSARQVRRRREEPQTPAEPEEEKEVRYRSSNCQTRRHATQATFHIRPAMLSSYQGPWRKGDFTGHCWVDGRFL